MNFRPKKSLGQNFLTNPHIVQKIIATAGLQGNELIVEIGPGFGILTEALLKNAKHVIAIEKDAKLFEYLKNKFESAQNLKLIRGDALTIPPPTKPFALIANIPYSITSPLLDHFIRNNYENLPRLAVLLVQKEVAEKICSRPPRMNVLALHVQTFGNPRIIASVSKNNFNPRPKVDSAIIKIEFPVKSKINVNHDKYFSLIHRAFGHKRKMLRSSLPEELLNKAKINPMRRPETLSVEDWANLTAQI